MLHVSSNHLSICSLYCLFKHGLWLWGVSPPRIRCMAEERGYVADYTQPSDQLRYKYPISTEAPAKMGEVALGLELNPKQSLENIV